MSRSNSRQNNELRPIKITPHYNQNAEGSCLIQIGNTELICTASVDEVVPSFLRNGNSGWLTAEYGMLPRATNTRTKREATIGKQSGRTQEIQRLIGRSLRASLDLKALGKRQITIDCDVIQADGGTRTAAITGGYVALMLALKTLKQRQIIKALPFKKQIYAVSCGIVNNEVRLDLDYLEDSNAATDANFVLTSTGNIIEVQSTAEAEDFTWDQLASMHKLAVAAGKEICKAQLQAINQT